MDSTPSSAPIPHPPLPYLTAGLPGCGGALKREPEDFVVEEVPAYLPCGSGEHLYLWIEKRGLSTPRVIEHLSRTLGLPRAAFGAAGLKDAHAVTRQWISIHHPADLPVQNAETAGLKILAVSRHANKLRRGHLKGNRFDVRIRNAVPPLGFGDLLGALSRQGFPNYFGEQRFGQDGGNAARGRALLLHTGQRRRKHSDRERLFVNAYQSALFNTLVARRLAEFGGLAAIVPGDLAVLHANGASFPVLAEECAAAQARCDAGELCASAPLFGWRVALAGGEPGRWERDVLAAEALTLDSFRLASKSLSPAGERRPVRVLPAGLASQPLPLPSGTDLRLTFTLPAGAYATTLLREVMKAPEPSPAAASGAQDRESAHG